MGRKSYRFAECAGVLALSLALAACVEEEDLDAELAAEEESEDEDDDLRTTCLYWAVPATDDTDTLVGAATQVSTNDVSDGGCDLHMFQVAASPPAHRARKIEFEAVSFFEPPDEYQAKVWTKSCAHGCGDFVGQTVPLTVTGGDIVCYGPGVCIQRPWLVTGELNLSASNVVYDIRAGMRTLLADDTPLAVEIYVSE